jgi:uncharacterized protein (DUF2384 family)
MGTTMATKPPSTKSSVKPAHPGRSGKKSPHTSSHIPKSIRELVLEMIGTERGADAWLAMPNPELGGRTPSELIAAGQTAVVEQFVQANLHGNFG